MAADAAWRVTGFMLRVSLATMLMRPGDTGGGLLLGSYPDGGATTRSTFEGGRGCNKFDPVMGGNGTKIAPTGDIFHQPPGQMR